MAAVTASTLQLLAWVAEESRTHAETVDVWKTSWARDRVERAERRCS